MTTTKPLWKEYLTQQVELEMANLYAAFLRLPSPDLDHSYIEQGEHMERMSRSQKVSTARSLLNGMLRAFMPRIQIAVLTSNLRGEEGEYFADMLIELAAKIEAMPVTYAQDGLGEAAMVHLHYFRGGWDFWVTEKDVGSPDPEDFVNGEPPQYQAFGLRKMNGDPKFSYINLCELIHNGVELDLHWTPKTVAECRK